jgi:hypothetical protein
MNDIKEKNKEVVILVNDFDIEKKMFEDHSLHERYQFSLNYQGSNYKGIYHNGDISWFHPQPHNELEDEHINNIEEAVYKKIQNHLQ